MLNLWMYCGRRCDRFSAEGGAHTWTYVSVTIVLSYSVLLAHHESIMPDLIVIVNKLEEVVRSSSLG
jgi:hypothetical protein